MKALRNLFYLAIVCIAITGFQQPDNWYLHESEYYSIKFPEKPQFSSQVVPGETKDMQMDLFMHQPTDKKDGNIAFQLLTLIYHDSLIHSSNTEYVDLYFRHTIDAAIETAEGKLILEKDISMSGFPGRIVNFQINEGRYVVTLHIYLVENRMIAAQAITETLKIGNPQLQKFYDSFRIRSR